MAFFGEIKNSAEISFKRQVAFNKQVSGVHQPMRDETLIPPSNYLMSLII